MLKIKQMMYLLKLLNGERVVVPVGTADAEYVRGLEALGLVTTEPYSLSVMEGHDERLPLPSDGAHHDAGMRGRGNKGASTVKLTECGYAHMRGLLAAPLPVRKYVWVSPFLGGGEKSQDTALPSD